jgi:poly(A) polymerase/tRNA nucleotidyltransferase (CCA-adding enzyme)
MTAERRATVPHGAAWLTSGPVARLLAILSKNGEEARAIGGAVRNAMLDIPVKEVDIATTAVPQEVVRRAKAAHFKPVPTGIDHGTVTVVVDGHPLEVTTLREEVETYGRRAKVSFGRDWTRDAERRDFTINALSASADGTVYDYVGGLDDLAARRVRFIGEPAKRIAEDFLRILRFFRIHAAYGQGALDPDALAACIAARDGLAGLSAERIQAEVMKLLVAPGASQALEAMGDAGLLLILLGGVTYQASLDQMIAVEQRLGVAPDATRRLGALAVAIPEDAERLAERLRLPNKESDRLDSMAHRWRRWSSLDEDGARIRLYKLGEPRYRDRMMMAFARVGPDIDFDRMVRLVTLPERWPAPAFPLKAADFIARGLSPGPALGAALAQAENAWIDAGFPLEPATVDAIAAAAARVALQSGRR